MTKKQLKILIESRFDALLLEQEEEDMEWAGLPYKEVVARLRSYGVKSLKGAWWKKFKRNSEVRRKYRNWFRNRGKIKLDSAGNKWRKTKGTENWEKISKGEKKPPSLKTSGDTDQYGNLMSPTNFDKADDKNAFKLYVQAAKNRKKYQYPPGVPTHEPIFLNPKHPYFGLTSGEVAYIRGNKDAGDPPSRKYEIGVATEPNKEKSEAMVKGWIAKHSKKPGEQKTSPEKKPEPQKGIDTSHGKLTSPSAIAAYREKLKKDKQQAST